MPDLILIWFAFIIGGFSFIWTNILLDEGMIFHFVWKWIHKIPYEAIRKPLGACEYCFGGQLALWGYLFLTQEYSILEHIQFIILTILIIHILIKKL